MRTRPEPESLLVTDVALFDDATPDTFSWQKKRDAGYRRGEMKTWLEHFPHWRDPIVVHRAIADVLDAGPRDEEELAFAQAVDLAPKTEVHVHAEAAVPADFYRGLVLPGAQPMSTGPFADFADFLNRWIGNLALRRRSDDYAALARAFVEDRGARRIVRTECHFSPLDTSLYRSRFGSQLPALDLADNIACFAVGLRDGMAAASGRVRVRAIVDLVYLAKEADLDAAFAVLRRFVTSPDNRDDTGERIIVGIGLGGGELPERADFLAQALGRFRALGLKLDLHSGEQPKVTPAEHARALEVLQPERVGHGIRGADAGFFFDGALAACPLSNVVLRCHAAGLATHPVGEMVRRGLNVSVNTDDPLLFGTNLVIEYVALRRAFAFDRDFFATTQANARRQLFAVDG